LQRVLGAFFYKLEQIDIEGAEFAVLNQILTDFPVELPFAQLQIELHIDRFPAENQYAALRTTFTALIEAGLRPFNSEPNLITLDGIYFYTEFAFLNVKSPISPFHLKQLSIKATIDQL